MNIDNIRRLCEVLYRQPPKSCALCQAARLFLEGIRGRKLSPSLYKGNAPGRSSAPPRIFFRCLLPITVLNVTLF